MRATFRLKAKLLAIFTLTTLVVASGCATQNKFSDVTTTTRKAVVTANDAREQTPTRGTAVGNIAPDFQLARTDGSIVKSDDLRGQPAVLVFWTAWCPSCKEEAPHVNELAAKFEPRGVRVLGINIQDSPARLAGGVREFGIQYGGRGLRCRGRASYKASARRPRFLESKHRSLFGYEGRQVAAQLARACQSRISAVEYFNTKMQRTCGSLIVRLPF